MYELWQSGRCQCSGLYEMWSESQNPQKVLRKLWQQRSRNCYSLYRLWLCLAFFLSTAICYAAGTHKFRTKRLAYHAFIVHLFRWLWHSSLLYRSHGHRCGAAFDWRWLWHLGTDRSNHHHYRQLYRCTRISALQTIGSFCPFCSSGRGSWYLRYA